MSTTTALFGETLAPASELESDRYLPLSLEVEGQANEYVVLRANVEHGIGPYMIIHFLMNGYPHREPLVDLLYRLKDDGILYPSMAQLINQITLPELEREGRHNAEHSALSRWQAPAELQHTE